MVRRHNNRRYSKHKKEVIRPTYEKIGVEIFSYDHKYTKAFLPYFEDIDGENAVKVNQRSLRCYSSKDKETSYLLFMDYNVEEEATYRIDILYENTNAQDYMGEFDLSLISKKSTQMYSNNSRANEYLKLLEELNQKLKVTAGEGRKDIERQISVYTYKLLKETKRVDGEDMSFDGEKNIIKMKTIYKTLSELGQYRLSLELPHNVLFIGASIRKLKIYTGDNLDSAGTNLAFTEASVTKTGQVKPAEASFEIDYDNSFECNLTKTGFYFDYADEINIYVKENADYSNNEMVRRFGGYISTVTPNDNRSVLTIHCVDRLQDGVNHFILDSLVLLEGTTDSEDIAYLNPISFDTYGEALKYLCDIHQVTLKSNISKNFLVAGEKYSTGLALTFGKDKDIKEITTNNCKAESQSSFITVRNNSGGSKEQYFMIYNGRQHSKLPVDITNHLTFHMVYGLGDPKMEEKIETETTEGDGGDAGGQGYGKCGVSSDGKYLMAIGLPSAGKDPMSGWTKTIFQRKCPHCGSNNLIWDWNWGSGKACNGRYEGGSAEGHIFCVSCDADYSVQGYEHISGSNYAMTKVSSTVKSSREEAQKLKSGGMSSGGGGNSETTVKDTTEESINAIGIKMKKYVYMLGGSSTYPEMRRTGTGDCHAFSDAIFTELKGRNIPCKVFEYAANGLANFRSVVYKNANGQWVDFPYQKYNLDKALYPPKSRPNANGNGVMNHSGAKSAEAVKAAEEGGSVTITRGYDKDKPPQFYIEIIYTNEQKWSAHQKKVYLNFTQKAKTDEDIRGLTTHWINNALRQSSVDLKGWFADNEAGKNIYLISIRFIAPSIATDDENAEPNWYTFDDSTQDYSSCKMDLYQIIFDDAMALNPTDLQACGKTVNAVMEEIMNQSGYRATMIYGKHRKDDIINFSVDNQTKPRFTLFDGDDSNILDWTNISCSPVSSLRNRSICVFRNTRDKYAYVDTGSARSMLLYGEQATLQTISEQIGSKEAYFNARNSKDYNPEFDYNYTLVTPYAPNLQIGDLIETISDYKYLNDIKPLESIKIEYKHTTKPSIRTTLGVGELEPYLRIKDEMQQLRVENRRKSTYFGATASPIQDDDVYIWDN